MTMEDRQDRIIKENLNIKEKPIPTKVTILLKKQEELFKLAVTHPIRMWNVIIKNLILKSITLHQIINKEILLKAITAKNKME